jgi:hypothetical protein
MFDNRKRIIACLTSAAALLAVGAGLAIGSAGPDGASANGSLTHYQQFASNGSNAGTNSGAGQHRKTHAPVPPTSSTTTTTAAAHRTAPTVPPPPPVTTTTAAKTTPTTPPPPSSSGRWEPAASATLEWQWELDHPLSTSSAADLATSDTAYNGDTPPATDPTVYDIDGFDNSAATVAALHARGAKVICYIDVGTSENWRPDYASFPAALQGSSNGWAGERWLDTSPAGPDYSTLQSIMMARFEMCASKGFDAVEPDNMDGSENSTGFSITNAQQDAYDEWVATAVHSLGMSVAQKNFEDQSATLAPYFDFVIEEQCFQYNDCNDLAPYTAANKAVLEVEYSDQGANPASYCSTAIADHFSSVEFDTSLDAKVRVPCA